MKIEGEGGIPIPPFRDGDTLWLLSTDKVLESIYNR
jgi:hypothetical protein